MAQNRYYKGGNLFSNNHRSPNLPASCAMIDIDAVSFSNGRIDAIIEDKFKFDSATLGNPMVGEGTWQRSKLIAICKRLGCPLILTEESTSTIIRFFEEEQEKLADLSEYNVLSTADRVYVEIRWGRPAAVVFRTEGKKMQELDGDPIWKMATCLKLSLQIPMFLVNDVRKDGLIYMRQVDTDETHVISPNDPKSWGDVYRKIRLFSK